MSNQIKMLIRFGDSLPTKWMPMRYQEAVDLGLTNKWWRSLAIYLSLNHRDYDEWTSKEYPVEELPMGDST